MSSLRNLILFILLLGLVASTIAWPPAQHPRPGDGAAVLAGGGAILMLIAGMAITQSSTPYINTQREVPYNNSPVVKPVLSGHSSASTTEITAATIERYPHETHPPEIAAAKLTSATLLSVTTRTASVVPSSDKPLHNDRQDLSIVDRLSYIARQTLAATGCSRTVEQNALAIHSMYSRTWTSEDFLQEIVEFFDWLGQSITTFFSASSETKHHGNTAEWSDLFSSQAIIATTLQLLDIFEQAVSFWYATWLELAGFQLSTWFVAQCMALIVCTVWYVIYAANKAMIITGAGVEAVLAMVPQAWRLGSQYHADSTLKLTVTNILILRKLQEAAQIKEQTARAECAASKASLAQAQLEKETADVHATKARRVADAAKADRDRAMFERQENKARAEAAKAQQEEHEYERQSAEARIDAAKLDNEAALLASETAQIVASAEERIKITVEKLELASRHARTTTQPRDQPAAVLPVLARSKIFTTEIEPDNHPLSPKDCRGIVDAGVGVSDSHSDISSESSDDEDDTAPLKVPAKRVVTDKEFQIIKSLLTRGRNTKTTEATQECSVVKHLSQPAPNSVPSEQTVDKSRVTISDNEDTKQKKSAYKSEAVLPSTYQASQNAGSPVLRHKAAVKFAQAFPGGHTRINTSATDNECGIHALALSMKAQHPNLAVQATVDDFRQLAHSPEYREHCAAFGLEATGNFTTDQLATIAYVWFGQRGINMQLGVAAEGLEPQLINTNDSDRPDCLVVWIYNDRFADRMEADGFSAEGLLNHYEGLQAFRLFSDSGCDEFLQARRHLLQEDDAQTSMRHEEALTRPEADKKEESTQLAPVVKSSLVAPSCTESLNHEPFTDAHVKEGSEEVVDGEAAVLSDYSTSNMRNTAEALRHEGTADSQVASVTGVDCRVQVLVGSTDASFQQGSKQNIEVNTPFDRSSISDPTTIQPTNDLANESPYSFPHHLPKDDPSEPMQIDSPTVSTVVLDLDSDQDVKMKDAFELFAPSAPAYEDAGSKVATHVSGGYRAQSTNTDVRPPNFKLVNDSLLSPASAMTQGKIVTQGSGGDAHVALPMQQSPIKVPSSDNSLTRYRDQPSHDSGHSSEEDGGPDEMENLHDQEPQERKFGAQTIHDNHPFVRNGQMIGSELVEVTVQLGKHSIVDHQDLMIQHGDDLKAPHQDEDIVMKQADEVSNQPFEKLDEDEYMVTADYDVMNDGVNQGLEQSGTRIDDPMDIESDSPKHGQTFSPPTQAPNYDLTSTNLGGLDSDFYMPGESLLPPASEYNKFYNNHPYGNSGFAAGGTQDENPGNVDPRLLNVAQPDQFYPLPMWQFGDSTLSTFDPDLPMDLGFQVFPQNGPVTAAQPTLANTGEDWLRYLNSSKTGSDAGFPEQRSPADDLPDYVEDDQTGASFPQNVASDPVHIGNEIEIGGDSESVERFLRGEYTRGDQNEDDTHAVSDHSEDSDREFSKYLKRRKYLQEKMKNFDTQLGVTYPAGLPPVLAAVVSSDPYESSNLDDEESTDSDRTESSNQDDEESSDPGDDDEPYKPQPHGESDGEHESPGRRSHLSSFSENISTEGSDDDEDSVTDDDTDDRRERVRQRAPSPPSPEVTRYRGGGDNILSRCPPMEGLDDADPWGDADNEEDEEDEDTAARPQQDSDGDHEMADV